MSTFLDTLKLRFAEAQREHQEATVKFQRAQAEFQSATQKLQSWQIAIQTETLREQAEAARANQSASHQQVPAKPVENAPAISNTPAPITTEVNKAQIIREQLRQHPAGMTGKELWDAVKVQINHRAYIYSVLKRLRDKDEVILKKKKYRLVPKPGEEVETQMVQ